MSPLSLFGLFAVSAMLLCYALESRSAWFILGFSFSCALGIGLRIPAGGLAIRLRGGRLDRCGGAALVARALDASC